MYKSVLDNSKTITVQQSVVALVRKRVGTNPEHAFILLESLDSANNVLLSRYDCVVDEDTNNCIVLIKPKKVKPSDAFGVLKEMIGCDTSNLIGKYWSIKKIEADQLNQNILQSQFNYQANPVNYNVLGSNATGPKSADCARGISPKSAEAVTGEIKSSVRFFSKEESLVTAIVDETLNHVGESCFTWAREILFSIKNTQINKSLPFSFRDFIAAQPSHHLPDVKNNKKSM